MQRVWIAAVLSVLPMIAFAGDAAPGITASAVGLRVVGPSPNNTERLRPFNWSQGTTVSVALSSPEGGIISLDRRASKLTAFTDDQGKDLTKAETKEKHFGLMGFTGMSNISDDGKLAITEISVPGVPTKGATQLIVTGQVVLQTATKKQEFAAENVALKPGTPVKAGDIAFTVTKAGKPEWGGGGEGEFAVTLEAKEDLKRVASIEFVNEKGEKIQSRRTSSSSMGFGDKITVTSEYTLKQKVEAAKIVVTYWQDLNTVTVPIELKFGAGL